MDISQSAEPITDIWEISSILLLQNMLFSALFLKNNQIFVGYQPSLKMTLRVPRTHPKCCMVLLRSLSVLIMLLWNLSGFLSSFWDIFSKLWNTLYRKLTYNAVIYLKVVVKIYMTQMHRVTYLKCPAQWHETHSYCCATILTVHLQNLFIFPSGDSIPFPHELPLPSFTCRHPRFRPCGRDSSRDLVWVESRRIDQECGRWGQQR